MGENNVDADTPADDAVVSAVDDRVRREALERLASIDCDDDDWRIEPLPSLGSTTDDDDLASVPDTSLDHDAD